MLCIHKLEKALNCTIYSREAESPTDYTRGGLFVDFSISLVTD